MKVVIRHCGNDTRDSQHRVVKGDNLYLNGRDWVPKAEAEVFESPSGTVIARLPLGEASAMCTDLRALGATVELEEC